MSDELIRAAAALPIALLLPIAVSRLRGRPLFSAASAAVVLIVAFAPILDGWRAWAIIAVGVSLAAVAALDVSGVGYPIRLLTALIAALVFAAAVTDTDDAVDALATATKTDVVIVVCSGALCVFIGGGLIGHVLHPFASRLEADVGNSLSGLENAGRYIGWLERALLYGFLLAGAPGAAALVLAGKSLARFPSFSEEKFAEYYLIGSLMSLLVAMTCALAARAALGLTPLVPTD